MHPIQKKISDIRKIKIFEKVQPLANVEVQSANSSNRAKICPHCNLIHPETQGNSALSRRLKLPHFFFRKQDTRNLRFYDPQDSSSKPSCQISKLGIYIFELFHQWIKLELDQVAMWTLQPCSLHWSGFLLNKIGLLH